MARERKHVEVYYAALSPEDFQRVIDYLDHMDHVQLARLQCKLLARLKKEEADAAEQALLLDGACSPDTVRPPSSQPPERIDVE